MITIAHGVWLLPSLSQPHTPVYHHVSSVVAGGVVFSCRGRMSTAPNQHGELDYDAMDTDPPADQRCVTCVLNSKPETRVRVSFGLGDVVAVSVTDTAGAGVASFDLTDLDDADDGLGAVIEEFGGES